MLTITPIYAGLIALLFLALSLRVVRGRRQHKVSIGDADNSDLIKRMRVQANCAEYAPIGILLLMMAEFQEMPEGLVHLFGSMLLLGRIMHAYGLGSSPQLVKARKWGMFLTVGMIATTAVSNIGHAIF